MIVITGSTGFLGKYCVQEMSNTGLPLFLTTSNEKLVKEDGGHQFHYLNLNETESFNSLPYGIHTVLHLAAVIPQKDNYIPLLKFIDINAIGVKRLMEAAAKKGCKRFIYASTQMVVERAFYLPVDEVHPMVLQSDYGLSKALGEKYCLELAESLKMSAISLRFAQIYGYGENPGFVLTNFIDRALKGLPLPIYGSGRIVRDLLYVKDAVKAILLTLQSTTEGVFNIGSGKGVSIKELAESIADVFGSGKVSVEFNRDMTGEGYDFYLSTNKARTELGFVPGYSLREGLSDYKAEMFKMREKIYE